MLTVAKGSVWRSGGVDCVVALSASGRVVMVISGAPPRHLLLKDFLEHWEFQAKGRPTNAAGERVAVGDMVEHRNRLLRVLDVGYDLVMLLTRYDEIIVMSLCAVKRVRVSKKLVMSSLRKE